MNTLTKAKTREIIEDFAKDIDQRKRLGPKPAKCVINFRQESRTGIERDIYYVPTELLRYRKDNGRISSDILHYEKHNGVLNEKSEEAQRIIEGFLRAKDKEKTEDLFNIIEHELQRDPAIITCDGFLINGNRRKMVLEMLQKKHPGDTRFTDMKVVILPGVDDEGGPPTLFEIEQIENRYQLQSEGKADYYAFDRALSIRRKIDCGLSLEAQLKDDPSYAGLDEKKFKEAVKKCEKEYLKPLECIDKYLDYLQREGLYSTISTGMGDPEGRWQAFHDYYNSVYVKLQDEKKCYQIGIDDDEKGDIEDIAFKIIRMREFPNLPKAHVIMRNLTKWLSNEHAKKELLKIKNIDLKLPKEERFDKDGKEYNERKIDNIWAKQNSSTMVNLVKKARDNYEYKKEKDTPIELLETALKKLYHENMRTSSVDISNYDKAMKLTRDIQARASEIEDEIYAHKKKLEKLAKRYKK